MPGGSKGCNTETKYRENNRIQVKHIRAQQVITEVENTSGKEVKDFQNKAGKRCRM